MPRKSPDKYLLDMMLAGMSGLDFLENFDVKTKSPGTIVVGLSAVGNPSIIERAKAHGVSEYLVKSDYLPRQVAARLRELLAARTNPPSGS